MYVVDSADADAMDVARHELMDLIQKPALAGIPLLVLGNKNDIEGAANVDELITKLQLKDVQGREVCCYSVSAKNQVSTEHWHHVAAVDRALRCVYGSVIRA